MLFGSVSLAAGTIVMYLGLLRALDPHFADKAGAGSLRAAVASGVIAILITTVFGFVLLPFESAYPSLLEEVLLTGFVEEYAKFLAFAIVLRRRDAFREPLDAATHAAAVGLGFSVIENIMYGFAYDHLRVHLARVFIATPGHMMLCALWGIYWAGRKNGNWKGRFWRSPFALVAVLAPSATLHGLYNHLMMADRPWLATAVDGAMLVVAGILIAALWRASPYRIVPELWTAAQTKAALRPLRVALARNPSSFLLHRKLAECSLRLGNWPQALAAVRVCRVTRPDDPDLLAIEGSTLVAQGKSAHGLALLERGARMLGYAGRRRMERRLLRLLGMRTPATTPKEHLATRFVLSSTLRRLAIAPAPRAAEAATAPR